MQLHPLNRKFSWQRNADLPDIEPSQPTIARPDEMVSEQARRFAQHSVMRDLVQDLIGRKVRLYWDELVYKRPGTQEDFPWHQDNGYNYVQPQQYLNRWIALTDATINNGCPWIAPGQYVNGTPHPRGSNLTQGICKTYILQYAPDGAMIRSRGVAAQPANDPQRQFLVA